MKIFPPIFNLNDLKRSTICLLIYCSAIVYCSEMDVIEDSQLSVPELIRKHGYPVEVYHIVTPDFYILELHRIPFGLQTNKRLGDVVFLQHGILCSSADYIVPGPNESLGYMLADRGYDVWMGNSRSNKYGRQHLYLDPNSQAEFWDFTWHEIGYYDLPAMIDFALNVTGKKNLFYIGHSEGTTVFFVMASMRPDFNEKIRASFHLAPIAFLDHVFSPILRAVVFFQNSLSLLSDLFGIYEIPSNNIFGILFGDFFCNDYAITQFICTNNLFLITGFNYKQLNETLLPVVIGHTPAGAAMKQLRHFGQVIKSKHFQRYNYGIRRNLEKYGSFIPPNYNLTNIVSPTYVFYSVNDWVSSTVDVLRLCEELPNVKNRFLISDHKFNHLDYVYGIKAPELVYKKIFNFMRNH